MSWQDRTSKHFNRTAALSAFLSSRGNKRHHPFIDGLVEMAGTQPDIRCRRFTPQCDRLRQREYLFAGRHHPFAIGGTRLRCASRR